MPLYTYQCPVCACRRDVFKRIADLDRTEPCPKCNFAMNRQLVAPMVRGDYAGYTCPVSGKWIEGRRAHEENLARHGCRVFESGETSEFQRRRAREDADFEDRIAATAEEFVETLPTQKKEQLAAEIASGLDVGFERSTPNL